jgi:flagellar biosynthesis protein FlhA
MMGYTVVDPASIIVTHLTELIRGHADELLSRQDTRALLDALKEKYPAPVDELVPDVMSVGEVQRVLQSLLAEGVSIRDLVTVVETLGDKAKLTKDTGLLAEYCRQALARSIVRPHLTSENELNVITLDGALEAELSDAVVQTTDGSFVNLDPGRASKLVHALREQFEGVSQAGVTPVVLCSVKVRRHLKQLAAQASPRVPVFSYNEIQDNVDIRKVGMVSV